MGERTGTATDTYRLPAYTTARLTSYWQIDKRTRLTLDVHNLFDKTYYTASWGNLTVIPGLGRQGGGRGAGGVLIGAYSGYQQNWLLALVE